MKKFLLILLLSILTIFLVSISAQTVEYQYDKSGNISNRKTITLKSALSETEKESATKVLLDTDIEAKIYPNPTQGQLKIELSDYKEKEVLSFQLYDMNGRLLINTKKNEAINELDLSRFSNGTYILRMIRNGKPSSWRIIKTN